MAFQTFLQNSREDWLKSGHEIEICEPVESEVAPALDESLATKEPLSNWIERSISSWRASNSQNIQATELIQCLSKAGATNILDFKGLSTAEARAIWTPLADLPEAFVDHLLSRAPAFEELQKKSVSSASSSTSHPDRAKLRRTLPESFSAREANVGDGNGFEAAIATLRLAKSSQQIQPSHLAHALQKLSNMQEDAMEQRWQKLMGSKPPALPAARAHWLQSFSGQQASLIPTLGAEETIWRELSQWRRSADQYASSVRLWGQAASIVNKDPWPPSQEVLDIFVFFFRSGGSLAQYLSHIRAALRLLNMELGVLIDTSALTKGSVKISERTGQGRRVKVRASAEQTRNLAAVAREQFQREDVAESWVLARHFCLRYGSEVLPLSKNNDHSSVDIEECPDGRWQASITLKHRKLQHSSVQVVRKCICTMQGKRLCGVCILRRRCELQSEQLFAGITYSEGLGLLKAAASQLRFSDALDWGTHAFRRGWADEALKHGGPTALFYSGGWRGIAAFSYASAKSRGALAAAEWLVEFSDSSGDEL
jgi:hypothetical protein